jgi:hypothetical protein
MNERLKELAKQAMIFSHENGGWRISTHVPNDFQEKFAELIVKECVDTIADLHTWKTKDNREYPDLWHEGVMKATDHLLQHWGLSHK